MMNSFKCIVCSCIAVVAVVDLSSRMHGRFVPNQGIIKEWTEQASAESPQLRDHQDSYADW